MKKLFSFFWNLLAELAFDDYQRQTEEAGFSSGFIVVPRKIVNNFPPDERMTVISILRRLDYMTRQAYPDKRFQVILRNKDGRFRKLPRQPEQQESLIKEVKK